MIRNKSANELKDSKSAGCPGTTTAVEITKTYDIWWKISWNTKRKIYTTNIPSINLLHNKTTQFAKLRLRNWVKINDDAHTTYNTTRVKPV